VSLPPDAQELLGRARQVIAAESSAVLSVSESLDQNFVTVAEVLLACTGKLLITGSGTSGTIAMRAAHLFSVGGTPAFYLSPSDRLHGDLGVLQKDDLVMATSKGGGLEELNQFCSIAQLMILDALFLAVAQKNAGIAERNIRRTTSAVRGQRSF
jgi:D-arabinose 5-phosphate isomerase GutQ